MIYDFQNLDPVRVRFKAGKIKERNVSGGKARLFSRRWHGTIGFDESPGFYFLRTAGFHYSVVVACMLDE